MEKDVAKTLSIGVVLAIALSLTAIYGVYFSMSDEGGEPKEQLSEDDKFVKKLIEQVDGREWSREEVKCYYIYHADEYSVKIRNSWLVDYIELRKYGNSRVKLNPDSDLIDRYQNKLDKKIKNQYLGMVDG